MNIVALIGLTALLVLFLTLYGFTQVKSRQIAKANPPKGQFFNIDGVQIHARHLICAQSPDKPTIIFVHGASGNLLDQSTAFENKIKDQANLLFVDRPGHGWSERGAEHNRYPDKQADVIAKLMDKLEISEAIIVGHSFGCSVTASFALGHPDKVKGLLFIAPVAYPWPGGIAWYYTLTSMPIIGWIFANTLALPAGLARVKRGSQCVFLPNKMPQNYIEETAPYMVLRPLTFRANSKDIASLFPYVKKTWPRYKDIEKPTIIISGNDDNVVFPYIHSAGLGRHIEGAELVEIDNLGHKPDHIATDIAESAIKKLIDGNDTTDLIKMARKLEQKLARQNS